MSNQSHTCTKKQCYYCYEMNRINKDHPVYKFKKKTSYEYRKQKEFKLMAESFKTAS